jgi:hypothetical protein
VNPHFVAFREWSNRRKLCHYEQNADEYGLLQTFLNMQRAREAETIQIFTGNKYVSSVTFSAFKTVRLVNSDSCDLNSRFGVPKFFVH